jgi:hypothetical protein
MTALLLPSLVFSIVVESVTVRVVCIGFATVFRHLKNQMNDSLGYGGFWSSTTFLLISLNL